MAGSFYGGRPGASFTIKKTYSRFSDMIEKIGNTTENQNEVGYGEYILIDTSDSNRRDIANGRVFCREYGHNLKNDDNLPTGIVEGYEDGIFGIRYIGEIRGPEGPAPEFEFINYNDFDSDDYKDDEVIENELTYGKGLVSGKNNNNIKYKYVITSSDTGESTIVKMGFQVPYIDIGTIGLTSFDETNNNEKPSLEIETFNENNPDDPYSQNPFVWNVSAKFPQGDKITNFRFDNDIMTYDRTYWNGTQFTTSTINVEGKPWIEYQNVVIAGILKTESQDISQELANSEYSDSDAIIGKVVAVVTSNETVYYACLPRDEENPKTPSAWKRVPGIQTESGVISFGNDNDFDIFKEKRKNIVNSLFIHTTNDDALDIE